MLHGPRNKKVWALHGPRRRAFEWARAQATKRGFPPDTKQTVQIVVDGEKCLEQRLRELFPNARFDCAGMRWICERSQPLLQLRCIELNGDWDDFLAWVGEQTCQELQRTQRVQIRTHQLPQLAEAA